MPIDVHMLCSGRLALFLALLFAGCTATRNVAVSTFRVLDTPHRLIRERFDSPETTTTTTTTTETSDVVHPGRPVEPRAQTQRRTTQTQPASTPRSPGTSTAATQPKPRLSATPRPSPAQTAQFPTAKPVPGKPGYVYSVDPKGGIVDVTGYKSGDKAKDPYTQQIFIVP